MTRTAEQKFKECHDLSQIIVQKVKRCSGREINIEILSVKPEIYMRSSDAFKITISHDYSTFIDSITLSPKDALLYLLGMSQMLELFTDNDIKY